MTLGRGNAHFCRAVLLAACLCLAATGLRTGAPVRAATPALQLPDAPGRETLLKVCSTCHQPERAASVRLTREGWEEVVADMIRRGAKGTPEEFAFVTEYLATHFLGEAARPLNINTASQIDLESVAGLLRREASAVRSWIEKNGICNDLADLKEVPGLDYKKIEDRKDFLVCFPPVPAPPPE
jgi:competence protein ComEA